MEPVATIEIIDYEPRYAADFKRLNVEWLQKYFTVEPIDEMVLSQPDDAILAPGGAILLARVIDAGGGSKDAGAIVGTCALIRALSAHNADKADQPDSADRVDRVDDEPRYELSKMAVTERYQGQGIARRLLVATLERYRALGGRELFLESNSQLTPALTLYESVGFVHAPRPGGESHYVRGDVYMVLREPGERRFQSASADPIR